MEDIILSVSQNLKEFDGTRWAILVILLLWAVYSLISLLNSMCSGLCQESVPAHTSSSSEPEASRYRQASPKPFSYNPSFSHAPFQYQTAQGLHGRVYMLAVFVSTTHNHWDRNSVARVESQIIECQNWIKSQASRYGCHDISFINGTIGGCYDGMTTWLFHHPTFGDSIERKIDFINEALAVDGYAPLYQLAENMCARNNCSQFHVMLFSKSAGHCHAYTPWRVNNRPFDIAILYDRFKGRQLHLGTICHEMIHLFGGYDLYKRPGFSTEKENYVRFHYPDSIMQEDEVNSLILKQIDPLNAWLLGIGTKQADFDWLCNKYE